MKTFGQRVKERREELGMTQDELAKKMGYKSRSSINKIEKDERNMKQSQIAQLASALNTDPAYLMGWKMPDNLIKPSAYAIPILGTICCGDGTDWSQEYDGQFFVDSSIRANYCLHVKGDSMSEAGIYDGDVAFIDQNCEVDDGQIYAVGLRSENEAVLKKVYKDKDSIILQPCNGKYRPMVEKPEDVYIIGKLVGIYHKM